MQPLQKKAPAVCRGYSCYLWGLRYLLKHALRVEYDYVIVIPFDKKKRDSIRAIAQAKLTPDQLERVRFLDVEGLFFFVEELEAHLASKEELVRGYKVKVNYQPMEVEDKKARKRAISKVILGALGRKRRKDDATPEGRS